MTDCYLEQAPFFQCCCQCVYHRPVHHHCSATPTDEKIRIQEKQGHSCICGVQKGWACVIPAELGMQVYDNWPEHSVGCELYYAKEDKKA